MNHLIRFASMFVFAAAALVPVARAADAHMPGVNVVGSIKLMAAAGDSIIAARHHRHDYIYLAHASDKSVDVIDVSNPAAPRQLSGMDADRVRQMSQADVQHVLSAATTGTARVLDLSDPANVQVVAEFPGAISTTTDRRKLIYVLDQDSLRILAAPQEDKQESDDGWFRNAMTPG